jgi:hypothetical protein
MKRLVILGMLVVLCAVSPVFAQSPLRLIPFTGVLTDAQGQPRGGLVALSLAIYEEPVGGTPLWVETVTAELDSRGRYQIVLGATTDGVRVDLFTSGAARWLGVQVNSEEELPRMPLLAVPYAVAAAEAATLGGKAPEEFVLVDSVRETVREEVESHSDALRNSDADVGASATVNVIPKYLDIGGTLVDSALAETGGRFGVNTLNPAYAVQVHGGASHSLLQFTNTLTGGGATEGVYFGVLNNDLAFRVMNQENSGIELFTNGQRRVTVNANGNVGIGRRTANYLTQLHSTGGHALLQFTNTTTGETAADGVYFGVLNGDPTFRIMNQESGGIDMFTTGARRVTVTAAGNVGIGTASPTSMLHVAGNAVIDGNIGAKYQDVAEWVEACAALEPGTVVVIESGHTNHVEASTGAYDAKVVGAVSAQPGLILGEAGPNKVMVAQSGRVRIKVDASYGAIKEGDLLVTSPTAGHAMRSEPVNLSGVSIHRPGTLLGKALESFAGERGDILALLTLQ